MRVTFDTEEGRIPLDLIIDAFVELEANRRGAHLSRNIDALLLAIKEETLPKSIEDFLDKAAGKLLELHNYALKASVTAKTLYYVDLKWNNIIGKEPVNVTITVLKRRNGEKMWKVSVGIKGMSVCPSAMDTISKITGIPWSLCPSHSQKVLVKGSVTTRGEFVRIEDIAQALFKSPSAPTFTRLKRNEEAELILSAFKNPKFIEDIARDAMCNLYRMLKEKRILQALIEVRIESLESIHPHNVYASRRALLSEIEKEVQECTAN